MLFVKHNIELNSYHQIQRIVSIKYKNIESDELLGLTCMLD